MTYLEGQPASELLASAALSLQRGQLQVAHRLAQHGIEGVSPKSQQFWALCFIRAEAMRMEGKLCEALDYMQSLCPQLSENSELAVSANMHIGYCLGLLGRHQEARFLLDECMAAASAFGSVVFRCEVKARLAMLDFLSNDLRKAESTYREILEEQPDEIGWYLRCVALSGTGKILFHTKRYHEAIKHLDEAITIARREGAMLMIAGCQSEVGLCALALGDSEKALSLLRDSERIAWQLGALHIYSVVLGDIGNVYLAQDDYWTAIPYYQRALNLALILKDPAKVDNWSHNIRLAYDHFRRFIASSEKC